MQAAKAAAKTFFKMVLFCQHNKAIFINIIMNSFNKFLLAHFLSGIVVVLYLFLFRAIAPAMRISGNGYGCFWQCRVIHNAFLFLTPPRLLIHFPWYQYP